MIYIFECEECHAWAASYNFKDKTFDCSECGHKKYIEETTAYCPRCGHMYKRRTWFDPSGCEYCNYSFVD